MPESFEIAKGLGDAGLQMTLDSARQAMPLPVFEFTLSEETETENLLAYKAGKHQTKATLETTTEYQLTLSTEVPTWQSLGAARGEVFREFPGSVSCMRTGYFTIPANGEVSVPGLLAANAASTAVTIEEGGGISQEVVASAPSGATQVQIADGQLTFDTSRATETAFVTWFAIPTGGQVIGGPGTLKTISAFSFAGEVWDSSSNGSGGYIWIPNAQLTEKPDITFNGDKFTLEMTMEVLSYSDWSRPYMIGYDMVWPA